MAVNVETIKSRQELSPDLLLKNRQESDRLISELSDGCNLTNIKLTVNRGAKRFGMIFDEHGNACKEVDPDDGESRVVKIVGNQTWQFVDAIHAKMTTVEGAKKLMLWRWNDVTKQYEMDRSKYAPDNRQVGDEGAFEHYLRRYGTAKTRLVVGYPGVGALSQGIISFKEIIKAAKDSKGKLPANAKERVTLAFVAFMTETGTSKEDARKLLHNSWPEFFVK